MALSLGYVLSPEASTTLAQFIASASQLNGNQQATAKAIAAQGSGYIPIDTIDLSQTAQNYLTFYENERVQFAVEPVENRISGELLAFQLFKTLDTGKQNRITATNIRDFIDRADYFLRQIGALDEDDKIDLNQFVFFGSKINSIYKEVATANRPFGLVDFTSLFQQTIAQNNLVDFRSVLNNVLDFLTANSDGPASFKTFA